MRIDRLMSVALASIVLAVCGNRATADSQSAAAPRSEPSASNRSIVPPPRYSDEQLARLAYQSAVSDGTNAALIMFLARHPTNPHVEEARARLAARRTPDPPSAALAAAGPTDAGIVSDFDAARLADGTKELRAFVERYAPHPLVAEARRLMAAR